MTQRLGSGRSRRRGDLGRVGLGIIVVFLVAGAAHSLLLATVWDPAIYDPLTGYAARTATVDVVEVISDPSRQIDLERARLRHDPQADIGDTIEIVRQPAPPTWRHLLGTDPLGRDVFSQLLFGIRPALTVGAVAALVAGLGGMLMAAIAAVTRRHVDRAVQRVTEFALVLPALPVLLMVGSLFDAGPAVIGLVIGLVSGLGPTAIVLRAHALTVAAHPSVEAARIAGCGPWGIVRRHVMPALVPLAVLASMFTVAAAIGAEAILSMFGLVNVAMSWGVMINLADAGGYLTHGFAYWWLLVPVGTAVTVLSAAFYLVGRRWDGRVHPRLEDPVVTVGVEVARSASPLSSETLVDVQGLSVIYRGADGPFTAVDQIDLTVRAGQAVGIAGASGSGKSTVAWSLVRLLPQSATVRAHRMHVAGQDLARCDGAQLRQLRREAIGFVPQQAMGGWNPVMAIGDQIRLAVSAGAAVSARGVIDEAIAQAFGDVDLDPSIGRYRPHQLSGGMLQRAMIAMALVRKPQLLIVDEPTSSLDVVNQVELLEVLARVRRAHNLGLVHISHDLAALAGSCDVIAVMDAGRIVDRWQPGSGGQHPLTCQMVAAVASIGAP